MLANRAKLRSLLAYNDVTAVAALPDAIAVAREHYAVLNVLQEFAVTLLVVLLDSTDATHSGSNLCEAFPHQPP